MLRREFFALMAGAVAAPARSQPRTIPHLSILQSNAAQVLAFREEFARLGWQDGQTVRIDHRMARGGDPRPLAADLVASKPDVILCSTTPALKAVQELTKRIPVVFVVVADPVGEGFVASLARPGGNITGFSTYDPGLSGKWIELLRQAAPDVRRLAILFNPDTAPHSVFLNSLHASARALGVDAREAHVRAEQDVHDAVAGFATAQGGGLMVLPDTFTFGRSKLLASLALRHRLPTVFPFRHFVVDGGLMSYGVDITEQYRQAAKYVDRILRGHSAAELPVQAPTKFELFLNIATARELGLQLSPTLLASADEVVE